MLTCPYDSETFKHYAGLSAHIRLTHPAEWKGSIDSSLPDGRDLQSLGTPEPHALRGRPSNRALVKLPAPKASEDTDPPIGDQLYRAARAVVGKGEKKPPIPGKCPWCSYRGTHPPGLSRHIASHHPQHFKGTLSATLGYKGRDYRREYARRLKKPLTKGEKLAKQREYQRRWYAKRTPEERRAKWRKHAQAHRERLGMRPRLTKAQKRELRLEQQRNYARLRRERLAAADTNTMIPSKREVTRAHIDFCPHCGENLQAISIALGMMKGEGNKGSS